MIVLDPKTPTPEERAALLKLVTSAYATLQATYRTLEPNADAPPQYLFVHASRDPDIVPVDNASEQEVAQMLDQVRRMVANLKPDMVLKIWPVKAGGSSKASEELILLHVEGRSGTLAIATAPVKRKRDGKPPSLGKLTLQVFEDDDEQVQLTWGGGFYLDLLRGRSHATVH